MIVDYWLARKPAGDITLDVLDATGTAVRHLSSAAIPPVAEAARPPHPNFWVATPAALPTEAGTNRVNWDLRHEAPPSFSHSYEINANPGLTPPSPEGPLVPPGRYTLRLTVLGASYTQVVTVRNDPRSPATPVALAAQHALLLNITDGIRTAWDGHRQVTALRNAATSAVGADASADLATALAGLSARLDTVAGPESGRRGRGAAAPASFRDVNGALVGQLNAQDNADMAPTPAMLAAYGATCKDLAIVLAKWKGVVATDLAAFNAVLSRHGKPVVPAPSVPTAPPRC